MCLVKQPELSTQNPEEPSTAEELADPPGGLLHVRVLVRLPWLVLDEVEEVPEERPGHVGRGRVGRARAASLVDVSSRCAGRPGFGPALATGGVPGAVVVADV